MSEYKLPEPAIYDAGGKQFGYSNVQMQQAYQAGRDAMRETPAKNATCYICAIDLEEMKKPGIRLVEVSNLPFDAWTVPLYRWG